MNPNDIEYLISRIDSAIELINRGHVLNAYSDLSAAKAILEAHIDNPDLPLSFINDALEATEEMNAGETEIKP